MNLPNWDTWFHVLKYLIVMGLVLWFGLFFSFSELMIYFLVFCSDMPV